MLVSKNCLRDLASVPLGEKREEKNWREKFVEEKSRYRYLYEFVRTHLSFKTKSKTASIE